MSSDVSSSLPVRHTSPALSGSFDLIEPLLTRFKEICDQFQIITLNRQIEACENLFRQGHMIDVAILGQFKAGKSSFLNSLISKKFFQ